MILRQILHTEPVGISYLFGCGGQAAAVVVDPVADIETYLEAAKATGMKINYVIDTHVHADHISTGRALADAANAPYVLSEKANVAFPFKAVRDGDELLLGNVAIKVLSTPGHTPEHISLVVTDRTRAPEPWFVVTGHTLMIGDLGRTELATSAVEGANAGSVCGRSLSANPISSIGFERRHNWAFRIDNEADFISFMLQDIPPAPSEAAKLRAVNSGRAITSA